MQCLDALVPHVLSFPLVLWDTFNTSRLYTTGKQPLHDRTEDAIFCIAVDDDRVVRRRVDDVFIGYASLLFVLVRGVALGHGCRRRERMERMARARTMAPLDVINFMYSVWNWKNVGLQTLNNGHLPFFDLRHTLRTCAPALSRSVGPEPILSLPFLQTRLSSCTVELAKAFTSANFNTLAVYVLHRVTLHPASNFSSRRC